MLSASHELYCAGHLFQAAIAGHRVSGDDRLLAASRRFADHLVATFGPDGRDETDGHPNVECALVELARETGDDRCCGRGGCSSASPTPRSRTSSSLRSPTAPSSACRSRVTSGPT